MDKFKIATFAALTLAALSFAPAAVAENTGGGCLSDCEPSGGNPGNAKPVGNSPWDGITGNSGNNNDGPPAAPMNGQRKDNPFAQPGGKGDGPSPE